MHYETKAILNYTNKFLTTIKETPISITAKRKTKPQPNSGNGLNFNHISLGGGYGCSKAVLMSSAIIFLLDFSIR